jgi:hypothetical protein
MSEPVRFNFTYKEVAELLVKKQNLHEGLWAVTLELGFSVININKEVGSKDVRPAAVTIIDSIGLSPTTEENSLAVDAAKVNPKTGGGAPTKRKRKS